MNLKPNLKNLETRKLFCFLIHVIKTNLKSNSMLRLENSMKSNPINLDPKIEHLDMSHRIYNR